MIWNLIIAIDKAFGIGTNNTIPWSIKEDINFFQDVTTRPNTQSKPNVVIMGKNTWLSLPDSHTPLPNRINIITSSSLSPDSTKSNVHIYPTLRDAIVQCESINPHSVFIIGGAQLYEYFLLNHKSNISNVYITRINHDYNCQTKLSFQTIKSLEFDCLNTDFTKVLNETFELHDTQNNIPVQVTFEKWSRNQTLTKAEYQYQYLLKKVIKTGHYRQTRNSMTWSIFGEHMEWNLARGFPLLTTKRVALKQIFEELKWFLGGSTDVKLLEAKGVKIWNANTSREFLDSVGLEHLEEYDIGPLYPFQFRHYGLEYKGKNCDYEGGFDQINHVINLIKMDPHSRRILATSFNPKQALESPLYPCHSVVLQFYVEANNTLSLSCYNRSQDLFLGVVWNIASSALLIHLVCNVVNSDSGYTGPKLSPGRLIMNLGDVHVYSNHLEQSIRQILREPFDFPQVSINKSMSNITDIEFDDIVVEEYVAYPNIRAQMIA